MARLEAERRRRDDHRSRLPWVVAVAFSVSGVVHLAHPATFTPIVPRFLPGPTGLVYLSGAAELAVAVGLWARTQWAGYAAAGLLLVIWPANLQAAITAQQGHDLAAQIVEWVRLPLQIPLIWCAVPRHTPACSTPLIGDPL